MTSRLLLVVVGGLFLIVSSLEAEKARQTLKVTAVSYRAIPHQTTTYYTTPGRSNTSCYGSGTDGGYWSTVNVNCSTVTTPPTVQPVTVQRIEVWNLVEANGMLYTITCTANWVGSNCAWLNPGDTFPAEIEGRTMWITERKGGNMGKEARARHNLVDIRPKTRQADTEDSDRPRLELPRGDQQARSVSLSLTQTAKPLTRGQSAGADAASQSSPVLNAGQTLTNETIIDMSQAHISKDLILATISTYEARFSLGPADLIALTEAGVDEDVMKAMIAKMRSAQALSSAAVTAQPEASNERMRGPTSSAKSGADRRTVQPAHSPSEPVAQATEPSRASTNEENPENPPDARLTKLSSGRPNTQASAPSQAPFSITSVPPGADVRFNGKFVGNTPSVLHVNPGLYKILITKSGFKNWEREIDVRAGDSISLSPELEAALQQTNDAPSKPPSPASASARAAPAPVLVSISLDSAPLSAAVSIDGRLAGETPLSIRLDAGSHVLTVQKQGYRPWVQKIEIPPGGSMVIMADLQAVTVEQAPNVIFVSPKPSQKPKKT